MTLSKQQIEILLLTQNSVREIHYPTFYTRHIGEFIDNTYKTDSHPNDKRNTYKKGMSKGRMIGLEQAGWIGFVKL